MFYVMLSPYLMTSIGKDERKKLENAKKRVESKLRREGNIVDMVGEREKSVHIVKAC